MSRERDLMKFGRQLFGLSNLIGTDFGDVTVTRTERAPNDDGYRGVRVQFTVSSNAIGKALDGDGSEALERLTTPVEKGLKVLDDLQEAALLGLMRRTRDGEPDAVRWMEDHGIVSFEDGEVMAARVAALRATQSGEDREG